MNFRLFFASIVSILLIQMAGCSSRVELLQGISEGEANEALAALLETGVKAGKLPGKDGMVGLEVDSQDVAKSISILRAEGLPRERYAKMGEVFRKEGLISSPLEERARYLWALTQELSATVSQIDGVIKARVHVVLPERSSAGDPALPSSAAVFIKHKSGVNLDDNVPQVKRLISNSIPGLSTEKVTVILLAAGVKASEEGESRVIAEIQSTEVGDKEASDSRALEAGESSKQKTGGNAQVIFWGTVASFVILIAAFAYFAWSKWRKSIKFRWESLGPETAPSVAPVAQRADASVK